MAPQAVDEETAAAAAKTRVASELGHDRKHYHLINVVVDDGILIFPLVSATTTTGIRYRHKKGNRRAIILTPSHLKSTPHLVTLSSVCRGHSSSYLFWGFRLKLVARGTPL